MSFPGGGMGFQNPPVGNQGIITRPQFQSVNYVPGVSGWAIFRNGNVEFNSGTFRGTVTAGQFQGNNFVINSSGLFFYSAAPAFGTLQYSLTITAGTDGFGNAYLRGLTVYLPTNATAWNAYNFDFVASTQDLGEITFWQSPTGANGPYTASHQVIWRNSNIEFTVANMLFDGAITATGGTAGNPTIITTDTLHTLTPGNGWSGTLRYWLNTDNTFHIEVSNMTAGTPANGVTIATLPLGYRPTALRGFPIGCTTANAGIGPSMNINTAGVIQAAGVGAGSTGVYAEADIPLF